MPNNSVRAAAEGMPDYPRNPHLFAFVRKVLMFWHARAGREPIVSNFVPESFMNQHVTRRNVFATTASAFVAARFPPAGAVVAPDQPANAAPTDIEAIAQGWAVIGPLERKFLYDQLYALHEGEPNIINKTADYTFDEWLADIPQWERDMIGQAFQSPDIRTY
ncbi:MAG: hypothetical protein E5Y02_25475 [Mesorhizobium sp.]|nr:MAG: hypothetical protein E5Y02_25475 [Mesorhizobium sp.]